MEITRAQLGPSAEAVDHDPVAICFEARSEPPMLPRAAALLARACEKAC
jgi:hypothetical protein